MAYRIISHEVHPNDGTYNVVFSDFKGDWSDFMVGYGNTLNFQIDVGASILSSVTLNHRGISNLNLVADTGVNINMNDGVWRGTLRVTYGGVQLHGAGTWLNQHAEVTHGRTAQVLPETVTLGGVGDVRISLGARMEFIGPVGPDQAVDVATNGTVIIDHLSTFQASVHLSDAFTGIHITGTLADNWMITDLPGADRVDFFHGATYAGSLLLDAATPHITLTTPGVIDITA